MAGETVTLASLVKYIWGPVIAFLGFFIRKEILDMNKRVQKLEEAQKETLTEEKTRQMIRDLLAPIHITNNMIREELKEIKDEVKKKN